MPGLQRLAARLTSVAPERFITLACLPYWNVEHAAAEVPRCASQGHKGFVTTGAPHAHGLPFLADRRWDPLWSI